MCYNAINFQNTLNVKCDNAQRTDYFEAIDGCSNINRYVEQNFVQALPEFISISKNAKYHVSSIQ